MAGSTGNQHDTREYWRIGLLLVLAFLGHDLLMAMESPVTPGQSFPLECHVILDSPIARSAAPASDHSSPDHPSDCGVVQVVAPRNADDALVLDLSQATVSALVIPQTALSQAVIVTTWQDPHQPPGGIRAFLQVYRI